MTADAIERPAPSARAKQILGVGDIVAQTLAIFFRRLPVVLLLTIPAAAAMVGILYLSLIEFERELQEFLGVSRRLGDMLLGYLSFTVAFGTGAALASGPLAGVAEAYIQGQRTPLRACFAMMFRRLAMTLSLGVLLAAGVMFLMFVNAVLPRTFTGLLPMLMSLALSMYLLARWAPALPTAVLEGKGFDSLRRSDWLSAGYRWQGTGTLILAWVIGVIFGGAFAAGLLLGGAFVFNDVFDVGPAGRVEEVLLFLDFGIGLSIAIAIITLAVIVLRLRLIEIKEPPDIKDMITVFE